MTAAPEPCPACGTAEANPDTGYYRANCQECAARMLAHGPEHFDAMAAAAFTPAYRSALQAVFGGGWMDGHVRVRAWSKRIAAWRDLIR
jgi:hypothetical protein